uniref:Interferon alpha-inducible protein 27-like protein 2A n=1 Tax=Sparus aurata TaxID=8175 RepID=A0A671XQE0_SPAAU
MKPRTAVCIGVGAAVAVVGAPLALGAAGFTSAGIAAGSIAAKMMSAAAIANGGGVAAGSAVAVLQSAGAAGLSGGATAAVEERWQQEAQWLFCRQQVQLDCQELPLQLWAALEDCWEGWLQSSSEYGLRTEDVVHFTDCKAH